MIRFDKDKNSLRISIFVKRIDFMEKNEIILTQDGSHTLFSKHFEQYYHSIFGALQESQRIFIELGLEYAFEHFEQISVFEMGFGMGLNAWLTQQMARQHQQKIDYTSIEAFPIEVSVAQMLNYNDSGNDFLALHEAEWNQEIVFDSFFHFKKIAISLENYHSEKSYNVIYYDAFAPEVQPELWTQEVFEKLASMMPQGGVLTTYCSKSYVRRNLKAAGFEVKKHTGPLGKREVSRAILGAKN